MGTALSSVFIPSHLRCVVTAGSPRTVLVTGATGFIGLAVAERYATAGWSVCAVARRTSDVRPLINRVPGVRLLETDGSTASLCEVVDAATPDMVVHLAAMVASETRLTEVATLLEANILFGTKLVEAMVRVGARRLVNTGTPAQHGRDGTVLPANLYGATKQAFEDVLAWYVGDQVAATTLYPIHVYGARDPHETRLMGLLRKAIRTGVPLSLSPGQQLIDLVHVEDVAEAYLIAGERLLEREAPGPHERYWVASREPVTLRSLIGEIEELTGRSVPVHWGGRAYRRREVMSPWIGKQLPGWAPRVSREDGLRRIFGDAT